VGLSTVKNAVRKSDGRERTTEGEEIGAPSQRRFAEKMEIGVWRTRDSRRKGRRSEADHQHEAAGPVRQQEAKGKGD